MREILRLFVAELLGRRIEWRVGNKTVIGARWRGEVYIVGEMVDKPPMVVPPLVFWAAIATVYFGFVIFRTDGI